MHSVRMPVMGVLVHLVPQRIIIWQPAYSSSGFIKFQCVLRDDLLLRITYIITPVDDAYVSLGWSPGSGTRSK